MADVTQLLDAAAGGDPSAAAELLPLVYDELRKLAAARMAGEALGHSLDATALVHEAYLRLVDPGKPEQWNGRGHFFAAEAMRRILVEAARRRATRKHGGDRDRVALDHFPAFSGDDRRTDLVALDDALTELARHDPQAARLVVLRFFAGLTHQEAADTLGIGRRTADRLWALARAWLYRRVSDE